MSGALSKKQALLLLRWVLVLSTCYLVLFGRPVREIDTVLALFVAFYLSSNVALAWLLPRVRSERLLEAGIVVFDSVAVTVAIALTGSRSSDFFLLYFVVMFLGALTERLGLVVGAAVFIGATHLYTVSRFVGVEHLLQDGYVLRAPFLLVVALFFGHLVENARERERAAELARARERMRRDFLSEVSHDLKNPLGVVQLLANHLLAGRAGELTEQQRDLVRRLHANTRQVVNLASNLLDAATIEAGKLTLRKTPARLEEVIDDAVELARSAAELRGVRIAVRRPVGLPGVAVDVLQMERVFSNLLDNAVKYARSGTDVDVRLETHDGRVEVTISNQGESIPEEELGAVFERYATRGTAGRVRGSGLGLFIVKHIVEAHGGTVGIESSSGRTTATVSLPAEKPEGTSFPVAVLPAVASGGSRG